MTSLYSQKSDKEEVNIPKEKIISKNLPFQNFNKNSFNRNSSKIVEKSKTKESLTRSLSEWKHVDFIHGPITLSQHFSSKYNKMFYILGDIHERQKDCHVPRSAVVSNISKFLEETVKINEPRIIDIFLEVEFISKERPFRTKYLPRQGFLIDISSDWNDCLQIQKKLCKYKNLRMHYADIRRSGRHYTDVETFEYLRESFETLYYNLKRKQGQFRNLEDEEDFQADFGYTKDLIKKIDIKGLRKIVRELKIDKQLDAISNRDVREAIEETFLTNGFYNPEFFDILHTEIEPLVDEAYASPSSAFDNLHQIGLSFELLVIWEAFLMDAYLIARAFRSFQIPEEDSRYIIIYVGEFHANRYRTFLDNILGFERIATSADHQNQCIDLKSFSQPFFWS